MSDREKWEYLAAVPYQDAKDPRVRQLAALCLELGANDPQRAIHVAFAVAGRAIRYQLDTARVGAEDIAGFTRPARDDDPLDAWRRGIDDCDAKPRLFVALVTALGFSARMAPVWKGEMLAHVYAEIERGRGWEPCELTLARAVIGEAPLSVPKEANGQWLET